MIDVAQIFIHIAFWLDKFCAFALELYDTNLMLRLKHSNVPAARKFRDITKQHGS